MGSITLQRFFLFNFIIHILSFTYMSVIGVYHNLSILL